MRREISPKRMHHALVATAWLSLVGGFDGARATPNGSPSPTAIPARAATWPGLIGIDYNPNHYPTGNRFNAHDVFFVGTGPSNQAITNVHTELSQLKAAGFSTVRSYQTVEYPWIDIIRRARSLGMSVIYEAAIPQNGTATDINTAVTVLRNVITAVGVNVFTGTVTLVLAGHENYSSTDISYLTSAIRQLRAALVNANASAVPVGSALVSGDLVTPANPTDMQTLIASYSAGAPLGFDPYPFQWGVTPPAQAATNTRLPNSIAWDYQRVKSQAFYVSPRPILMAETGWATAGTGQYANYYCYQQGNCQPSVANAARYLQALYGFVRDTSNRSGALIFEAYDEPAKDPQHASDAENHYGLFTRNCMLKNGNTNLLPNTQFVSADHLGCKGFIQGETFAVIGTQPGAATNQPPFTVAIRQTNPITLRSASMSVRVPSRNRTNPSVYPWPRFLLFNGGKVTISGVTSGASCSATAAVNGPTITWGKVACTDAANYPVTCRGAVCYLPWNNF